jgi:DNA-binding PadR family transcriptional regulator
MPPRPPALGEFELVVLLAVLHLVEHRQPAYGSSIRDVIAARANRPVARGAIYVTLDRLEGKRLLGSKLGDGGKERDNRPRRLFTVTAAGLAAAKHAVSMVNRMQAGLEPVLARPGNR